MVELKHKEKVAIDLLEKLALDLLEKLQACWTMSESCSKELEEEVLQDGPSMFEENIERFEKSIAEMKAVHDTVMKAVKDINAIINKRES
jgi:hypothetical protein